jgi:hypothetical protein
MLEPNQIYCGDCLELMKEMPDNSVDSVVTDPPYELTSGKNSKKGFMGKEWDGSGIAFNTDMWSECLRVLKPGGHLLAFGGTRTYHRMAVAIENAGFDVRDMIEWVYGCLSQDTEILTINGWERYHKNIDKSPVLCYDANNNSFSFETPTKKFLYENKHTAYRIKSDFTDQIISKNHRCLIEREGKLIFKRAEALQCKENIPFLESLSGLPKTIYNAYEGTSVKKQDLLAKVQEYDIKKQAAKTKNSPDKNYLSDLWQDISNKKKQTFKILLSKLQWSSERSGMETARTQRQNQLEIRERASIENKNDWREKLGLERWCHLFQKKGQVCRPKNKICEMSTGVSGYGKKRRICNGTQIECCQNIKQTTNQSRISSPYQSQSNGQQNREFDVIQNKCRPQEIRTRSGYKTTLATITPVEYKGKVWCVEVPTGAFVARRNRQIFITGNSGFPKSHNIGKNIEKIKVGGIKNLKQIGTKKGIKVETGTHGFSYSKEYVAGKSMGGRQISGDIPVYEINNEWGGWGTALKPSHEPICMARKPLEKGLNVAENVLRWRTGGINIDESRVETEENLGRQQYSKTSALKCSNYEDKFVDPSRGLGRFPANLILTYPDKEYIMKDNLTNEQIEKALKWIYENAKYTMSNMQKTTIPKTE